MIPFKPKTSNFPKITKMVTSLCSCGGLSLTYEQAGKAIIYPRFPWTIHVRPNREDDLARYSLITSTYTIEQHCKRRLLRKKYFERIEVTEDLFLPLREYPVTEILAVFVANGVGKGKGEGFEPEFYHAVPDCGLDYDYPFSLSLSPAAMYYLGLAAWNMNRYRRRRFKAEANGILNWL